METVLRQFISKHVQLSEEEFAGLLARIEVRQFPRRAMIIREGDQEKYLNLVAVGILRKFFYKGNLEVITQLAGEGALISSSVSFLARSPSLYNIETLETVTLLSISHEALEDLYTKSTSMERMGRIITTELYLAKEQWEQDHMSYDVKTRFMKFVSQQPDLLKRVPQKYLASYLNIKPETFSRLKHHLKPKPEAIA